MTGVAMVEAVVSMSAIWDRRSTTRRQFAVQWLLRHRLTAIGARQRGHNVPPRISVTVPCSSDSAATRSFRSRWEAAGCSATIDEMAGLAIVEVKASAKSELRFWFRNERCRRRGISAQGVSGPAIALFPHMLALNEIHIEIVVSRACSECSAAGSILPPIPFVAVRPVLNPRVSPLHPLLWPLLSCQPYLPDCSCP
jgi:hypothetical protein